MTVRSSSPPARTRRAQAGATLIEVLIALLILSGAALAYSAMQIQGISRNASALQRSKATQLAYSMADRMRANLAGVTAGNYNSLKTAVTAPNCGSTTACTPANMATLDYAQWSSTVSTLLPGGFGVVCVTSTPDTGTPASPACDGTGSTLAIKVFWSEKGKSSMFATVVRP